MYLCHTFNHHLDRMIHPEVRALGRSWAAFRICGYAGLAVAVLLAMTLVVRSGLSPWVMGGIIVAAVATFLVLSMVTKVITGEESLTYYHHEIAILLVATLLLWLLGQPVLSYLDPTILGVGAFMACGRLGCLMAGCCHGRVHSWGVRYRDEHAVAGFSPCYVGVRLFPVQAVESLYAFVIVVVGIGVVLGGRPPGEALAWYVVSYGVGRFFLEFLRGDASRHYVWGFSEAQWTSLLLISVLVWEELSGNLSFHAWHVGAFACLALVMISVALTRRLKRTITHRLLHPRHVREVAEAVRIDSRSATEQRDGSGESTAYPEVHVSNTSLGIWISVGRIGTGEGCVDHYTLSCRHGAMSDDTARSLARLILQLRHLPASGDLVKGSQGVFHLLMPSPTGARPASAAAEIRGALTPQAHAGVTE